MKKLTNPVFLQTTHYQLSEDDAELLRLEALEVKESVAPASRTIGVRFNAIHAGTTRNKHTFPIEELEKSATKWTKPFGKPILKNHDPYEEALGRVREADVIHFSDSDGVLQLVAGVSDEDAIQKILDQRYMTVSVGVMSSKVECSICGVNWFEDECDHTVGKIYAVEGTNKEIECTSVIREIEPIELSFVNSPADANDERYAGVIHIGESHEFEFYANDDEGVITKGKKIKSGKLPDNIALALKESYAEFLSQLDSEGEVQSQMKKEKTKAQTGSVEETLLDATSDDGTDITDGVAGEVVSEETDGTEEIVGEGTEETDTVEEDAVVETEDDITALESYLATPEDEPVAEASEEAVDEVVEDDTSNAASQIAELQNRVQELESENAELVSAQAKQQDAVAEWVKVARQILSRHIVDLKVVLKKAEGSDLDALEAIAAASTLKVLSEELNTLRKEFKSLDFGIDDVFSQNGILLSRTLTSDTSGDIVETASEEEIKESFSESELINSLTSLLSRKRTL